MLSTQDPAAQLYTLRHEFDGLLFSALLFHSECKIVHGGQRVGMLFSQYPPPRLYQLYFYLLRLRPSSLTPVRRSQVSYTAQCGRMALLSAPSKSSPSPVLPSAPPPSIVLDTLTLAPATLSYTTCSHPLRQVLSSALLPTSHTSSWLHDSLPLPTHTIPPSAISGLILAPRSIIHRSLPLGQLRV